MKFFITVIYCKGRHFSSITSKEPFLPLNGDHEVFRISEEASERVFLNLKIRARTKARELGIPWVSGIDQGPPPNSI